MCHMWRPEGLLWALSSFSHSHPRDSHVKMDVVYSYKSRIASISTVMSQTIVESQSRAFSSPSLTAKGTFARPSVIATTQTCRGGSQKKFNFGERVAITTFIISRKKYIKTYGQMPRPDLANIRTLHGVGSDEHSLPLACSNFVRVHLVF